MYQSLLFCLPVKSYEIANVMTEKKKGYFNFLFLLFFFFLFLNFTILY